MARLLPPGVASSHAQFVRVFRRNLAGCDDRIGQGCPRDGDTTLKGLWIDDDVVSERLHRVFVVAVKLALWVNK